MSRSAIALGCFAAGVLLACATAAWACSCTQWQTPQAELENVQLAVVARVEWTRPERGQPPYYSVTRFTVARTLKGERRPAWQIAHPNDGAAGCSVHFRPGEQVLLFAAPYKGRLLTNMCLQPRFPLAAYERALARR